MVQISEKILRRSLSDMSLWFIKLQNVHYATTPADFLVLGEFRYLIEVKEISVYKGYTSFSFDRLTQEKALIEFEKAHKNNFSYILFNFREKTLKKSCVLLAPLLVYLKLKKGLNKKSFNLEEAKLSFPQLKTLPESKVDLNQYIV